MLVLGCFSISDANVVVVVLIVAAVLRASKNNNEAFPVDGRVCVRVFCGLNSLVCVNLF